MTGAMSIVYFEPCKQDPQDDGDFEQNDGVLVRHCKATHECSKENILVRWVVCVSEEEPHQQTRREVV